MFSTKNVLKVRIIGLRDEVEKNEEKINSIVKVIKKEKKGKATLIVGWLRKRNFKKVKDLSSDRILIEVREPKENIENVPIELDNPPLLRPFESLVKLHSPPLYSTVNPTPFFAFFFLLSFGIMTAGVFNGAVLIVASLLLFVLKKDEKFLLITYMGISSFIFGLLFGEFLGGLVKIQPIWFNPFENPTKLMKVSLYIGIVEVSTGFILGITNSLILNSKKEVLNNLSLLLLLLAGVLYFKFIRLFSYILLGISCVLLVISRDLVKIIEVPHLIGDIFSFLRILAINLSHIGIATAFTKVALTFKPPFSIFFLLFEEIILLTIGILIAFAHSLRLQFIEFYTKFMKTGERWF